MNKLKDDPIHNFVSILKKGVSKFKNDFFPLFVVMFSLLFFYVICIEYPLIDELLGDIALKPDNGKYLSRCNGCGSAAYPDSASIHGTNPSDPWSKWTPEKQDNGKWTLKSDTGKYLARCNNCWYGAAYPDAAFVHESNPAISWAQWTKAKSGHFQYTYIRYILLIISSVSFQSPFSVVEFFGLPIEYP